MHTRSALIGSAVFAAVASCVPNNVNTCIADAGEADAGPLPPDGSSFIDAGVVVDSGSTPDASPGDAGSTQCSVDGNLGQCMDVGVCGGLPSFTSNPGYCPGPSNIQCCALTPNVANNPPVPAGWTLMQQANVTPAMTAWAVAILNSPGTYPMFTAALQTSGSLTVMARVEWHPPDFQNAAVHRGVTLYQ